MQSRNLQYQDILLLMQIATHNAISDGLLGKPTEIFCLYVNSIHAHIHSHLNSTQSVINCLQPVKTIKATTTDEASYFL